MKQFDYTIRAPQGIHSRPAGMLSREALNYASNCTITKDGKTSKLVQLLLMLSLGIRQGDTVTIAAEGADEDTAIAGLKTFFEANL